MNSENENENECVWDYATGIPGLVRNRESERYYSRMQIGGRRVMKALRTDVWSVAKLRHADNVAAAERQRQSLRRIEAGDGLLGELLDKQRTEYLADTGRAERSKVNIKSTHNRLVKHWKECFGTDLRTTKPSRITVDLMREFANFLHQKATFKMHKSRRVTRGYKPVTVNKTVELLHRILRMAVETGALATLPFELDPVVGGPIRKPEEKKKLTLPSLAKMRELFATIRRLPDPLPSNLIEMREYLTERAEESADFAEFMAYSGARVGEARSFRWEDDQPDSVIVRGTKTEGSRDREVPKIPALRDLIERMRAHRKAAGRELGGKVFRIRDCRDALATACRKVGIERLTHHSLRHFFATICIEAGVDIPTVSRWLGHVDGGVLAMNTYGHLRREHSFAAAAKVTLLPTPVSA